ncbi:hypothetical protein [Janthinobacterium sp.]|uniref:hypothetical protein n=1 Tax=Janthinobacterium sp. TaxID=1871054 RepID=UPI002620D940|nr:hypothetical protein [Janthinobacterium sp.]
MKKMRLDEKYLKNLRRKIIAKKTAPLTSNELDFFANLLEREFYNPELHQVIWDIAWQSPVNAAMLKIAQNIIAINVSADDDDVFNSHIEPIFSYYLHNSPSYEQEKILDRFEKSKSLRLRMIVAEFHMWKNHVLKGLHMMAKILDEENIDHAIADSICMWIAQKRTPELRNSFLHEAAQERKKGNISYAKTLEWICENLIR